MTDSVREKYLGDIVDQTGKIRSTVEDRRCKGYGIVAEILAIINEIPLGQYRMEIGLKLRQAMFINGVLFNSEACQSVTETEIKLLEAVDEHLLRSLVGAHSKTPLEFLFLEAGDLKPYTKFRNPTITPSGRKVTRQKEERKRKNAVNSGHLVP